jgi:SRSO17 transposase
MKWLSGGNPMTEQEIAGLGPAFAGYLGRFRACFGQKRIAAHFDTYCRGLLSDLPRKSVEPIALEAGNAVRTLQEFLTTSRWGHDQARDLLQRHLAAVVAAAPADGVGTVGDRRDQLPEVGRPHAGSPAAVPGLCRQD